MFKLSFTIANPFKRREGFFKHFSKDKSRRLSKNKSFEWQIAQWEMNNLFDFDLNLIWWGRDHAGPELMIEVFGLMVCIKIYDYRHWAYIANTWEEYEEK